MNAWMVAPYVADQYKVKPNLTLSYGLRWEPWISPVPTNGREAYFDPTTTAVSTRYPNAPLGMLFPGDPGVPSTGTASDYKRFFDPRLGIAWQPKALPNTSIRAAFGMYATPIDYSSWNHASDTQPFSPTYSFNTQSTTVNGVPLPIIPFDAPWSVYSPVGGVSPFPPFSAPGTNPGSSATFTTPVFIQSGFAPDYTDGRTYTWNLSLEHSFGANWLAKAAYVASESDHQNYVNDGNLGLPVCGPVSATCAQVTTNSFTYPNFTNVLNVYSDGTASYQSGQFTLERRFAHGLQFTANYTYSHTISWWDSDTTAFNGALYNPRCPRCNRGNSFADVPQIFVANFIYETPVLAGWNKGLKLALGGWQISGIYRAQSGQASFGGISCGCTSSWQLDGTDLADYASGVKSVTTHPGNLLHYLDASQFVQPQQGDSGTTGKNPAGLFGPGVNTWDLGFSKNFHITERYRLQIRGEMFNAFNRVTLGNANNDIASSSFGQITYTNGSYPSRVVQLAGKFNF